MAFIRTGEGLNQYWYQMLNAQLEYDTRAIYLFTFGDALNACLLDPLFERPDYREQVRTHPINEEDDRLPLKTYRAWILYYAGVLRDNSLLGMVANGPDLTPDAAEDFFEDR
jgi:hypothetical protein